MQKQKKETYGLHHLFEQVYVLQKDHLMRTHGAE